MRVVPGDLEIVEAVVEQRVRLALDDQLRQRARLARQLQLDLLHMVGVQVAIAPSPDEVAHFQARLLRHHVGQDRIRGDIEWYAQEDVGAALVELARQLAVGHVELEQRMAGRQLHRRHVRHVPGRDDHAARIGRGADLLEHLRDLVDVLAGGRRPVTPLVTVHGPQIAIGVGPFVPDRHAVFFQVRDIGRALQEPDQFMDDRLQVHFLGRQEREAFLQIEAHLVAEYRAGAGAGAVGFGGAMLLDMAHEVEILAHCGLCDEGTNNPSFYHPVQMGSLGAPWPVAGGAARRSAKRCNARRSASSGIASRLSPT